MNKHELLYQQHLLRSKVHDRIFDIVALIIRSGTWLFGIHLIFAGLQQVLQGHDADGIAAFAKIVEALNLGSILGYVWGAGATAAYVVANRGRKRAISEKSKYQKRAESLDPNRTTSGLTETGDTPETSEEV